MCPHANGDSTPNGKENMVGIENTIAKGVNGHSVNGNGTSAAQARNPYAPRAADFLNNVSNFKIIESTLRGTQHVLCVLYTDHSYLS
jgi:homocitrate synthase